MDPWLLELPIGACIAMEVAENHNDYVIMGPVASQITSLTIVLFNRLFRHRSEKTSKLHVTGLCAGNSPGTGEFPAQMASYAENASIWRRHHVATILFRTPSANIASRPSYLSYIFAWHISLPVRCEIQYITRTINAHDTQRRWIIDYIWWTRQQRTQIFSHPISTAVAGIKGYKTWKFRANPLYCILYSISQEICTRFCCALLCCGYAIVHNEFTWSIYPYSPGLLCWHWGNR